MSSRVTRTDALHRNQSPTPQASYPISRSAYVITAYLLMLSCAIESVQSAISGRRQANSLLAQSVRGRASLVSGCRSNGQDHLNPGGWSCEG
ncbi:uncharacterized protein M421DRAFT_302458 [Didymella exigua CBS 183.55]|uniref:Uncharacterized protein n=1 Tax=Didymella exigua CBS 183.55 TaxID=1150837 RepID=A0A6A5R719_9PLEO|nr:uncharacterized protein M421DRAFT_302458 [Didymella exigua CBS 183.55]KAF1923961.1 hypothetical protein M421DRAFT_302458 [Didymella exigua CBS 183.55]